MAKKIVIFGSKNKLSIGLIKYLLEKDYSITLALENVKNFPIRDNNLEIKQFNINEPESIDNILLSHDSVILTNNTTKTLTKTTVFSDTVSAITTSMENQGLKRLICIGGLGILQQDEKTLIKVHRKFPVFLVNIANDQLKMFETLQETELKWTIICPPNIVKGQKTMEYRTLKNYHPEGGKEISVEDLSHFIVNELSENKCIKARVGISY